MVGKTLTGLVVTRPSIAKKSPNTNMVGRAPVSPHGCAWVSECVSVWWDEPAQSFAMWQVNLPAVLQRCRRVTTSPQNPVRVTQTHAPTYSHSHTLTHRTSISVIRHSFLLYPQSFPRPVYFLSRSCACNITRKIHQNLSPVSLVRYFSYLLFQ